MNASYDALVDLLESIEHFVMRLDIYTYIPHTPALDEIVVKIIVELLSTLALVTKELKQGRTSKSIPIEELTLLNPTQKNLQKNYLERRTSSRCYKG
jgi:hypothetical protein